MKITSVIFASSLILSSALAFANSAETKRAVNTVGHKKGATTTTNRMQGRQPPPKPEAAPPNYAKPANSVGGAAGRIPLAHKGAGTTNDKNRKRSGNAKVNQNTVGKAGLDQVEGSHGDTPAAKLPPSKATAPIKQ